MGFLKYLPIVSKKSKIWPWTEEADPDIYNPEVEWPKISIVTPSFNQGEFIEETIRSVLLQNYPNLEYIIIDGGSTDKSVEIIKKYEPWLTYWISEKDNGQSDAINKGLEKCTGEIFNWINSDDVLEPNALYYIGKSFIQNPEVKVVTGKQEIREFPSGKSVWSYGITKQETIEDYLCNQYYAQQATFYKVSALTLPVETSLHFCMDIDLWVKFLLRFGINKICFLQEKIAIFRIHGASKTGVELEQFILDAYQIESIIFRNFKSKNIISSYLKYRLKKNKVDIKNSLYSVSSLDLRKFSRIWAHREIKRVSRLNLNVIERIIFSLIYWQYHPYQNKVTAIKCWVFDVLFPEFYHRLRLS
jgi:glycosyltransferase involved in cell wall biosynthesis